MSKVLGGPRSRALPAELDSSAQRQRAAAGMYDRCRLDEDTCQRLLFEWGYRRLAETYRRRGEPYPRLGTEGEIC